MIGEVLIMEQVEDIMALLLVVAHIMELEVHTTRLRIRIQHGIRKAHLLEIRYGIEPPDQVAELEVHHVPEVVHSANNP